MNEIAEISRKKVRRTQEQKKNKLCEEWRLSGLKKAAFYRRERLSASLFGKWLKNQENDSTKKMKLHLTSAN